MTEVWRDHIEWALSWPWSARIAVLLLALAIVGLTWLNIRQIASLRRRAVLLGLRATTIGLLLLVLAQPSWVSVSQHLASARTAVVIDRSASMALGKGDARRWDRALQAAKALAGDGAADWYSFGEVLEPAGSWQELAERRPDGERSNLGAVLRGLAAQRRTAPWKAVALISDGLDNATVRARNPVGTASLDSETLSELRQLQAPLHAIYIDDPVPVRDVAVAGVRVSSFGYTRTYVPVSVDIEVSGLGDASGSLTLQLSDNGKAMVTQQVPIAGPARRTVELEFQPLHVGTHILEAAVVPLPDEVTVANNRAHVGMRVVRDRTRVLHLAGHPSWDTRFLRSHLKGNTAVDLVSFYVMVGQGAGGMVSAEDTTLMPFPAKEIFEDSLSGFDLVILQDFPFGPFNLEQYLPQLAQYLQAGGAMLVLGGPQSLGAGGYAGTALADLLPVEVARSPSDGGWVSGPQKLTVTPVGAAHPASLLGRDAQESTAIWQMHRLVGRNSALRPRQGSHLLVTDPAGEPVLAVGEVGEGRTALLASDSLWMWAFGADVEADGDSNREVQRGHYHRLFDQLSAWLLRDPDLELLRIEAPGEPVPEGKPLAIEVQLRDGAGQPKVAVPLRYALVPLAELKGDPAADRSGPTTNASGQATLRADGLAAGAYLAVVEAEVDGRKQRASAAVIVASSHIEASQVQPSDRLLQLLARASLGTVYAGRAPAGGLPLPPVDRRDAAALADKQHTDLWSRPEVLALLVALLCGEWFLRRRWGLA